jgi:formylglycine-generating enzyme required for sulfatase activity
MAVNPVDEYLSNLRGISEQAGQQKIPTLAVQFQDTLLQLPALNAEVDHLLSQGAGVDYEALAKQLEGVLEKATSLMLDVSMLPAHILDAVSMREFIERLRTTLKIRTVSQLAEKFSELCARIERDIEAERKRQEAEKKARAKAEESVRAEAEAEVRAKAEAEARLEGLKFWTPEFLEREYVLIKGSASSGIADLYFARYPVTNKQYRLFIDYLEGKTPMLEEYFACSRFEEVLASVAKSGVWDGKGAHFSGFFYKEQQSLQELFRLKYDYNPKHNGDDQPVVGVSWYAAKAYCLWLLLIESCGRSRELYRLPTEQEWEWAASGGMREYPWGDESPGRGLANYGENVGHTTPVGCYPKGSTPEGLYDMAGNVWEWQENWFNADEHARALRGGSWLSLPGDLRCRVRYYCGFPDGRGNDYGFRVVRPSLP